MREPIPNIQFRPMTERDLDRVMEIELASHPFPWTRGIFSDCMRVGYLCRVAVVESQVQAFGVLSFGAQEAHILNLSTAPASRRRGIARTMLRALLTDARTLGADTILLEVRRSNSAAISLYEQEGFNEISVRRDYYPDAGGAREDALLLACALPPVA